MSAVVNANCEWRISVPGNKISALHLNVQMDVCDLGLANCLHSDYGGCIPFTRSSCSLMRVCVQQCVMDRPIWSSWVNWEVIWLSLSPLTHKKSYQAHRGNNDRGCSRAVMVGWMLQSAAAMPLYLCRLLWLLLSFFFWFNLVDEDRGERVEDDYLLCRWLKKRYKDGLLKLERRQKRDQRHKQWFSCLG